MLIELYLLYKPELYIFHLYLLSLLHYLVSKEDASIGHLLALLKKKIAEKVEQTERQTDSQCFIQRYKNREK